MAKYERMPNKVKEFLDKYHSSLQKDNLTTDIWNTPLDLRCKKSVTIDSIQYVVDVETVISPTYSSSWILTFS